MLKEGLRWFAKLVAWDAMVIGVSILFILFVIFILLPVWSWVFSTGF